MNVQQQQQIITGSTANSTLQHYLSNNHIVSNGNDHNLKNVHVQIVKQEQQGQRYIINRQFVPTGQLPQPEPQIQYWSIVEIESNNEINSYVLVESKDVIGNPKLETLTTGKLVIVNISGKQRRATVVMASSEYFLWCNILRTGWLTWNGVAVNFFYGKFSRISPLCATWLVLIKYVKYGGMWLVWGCKFLCLLHRWDFWEDWWWKMVLMQWDIGLLGRLKKSGPLAIGEWSLQGSKVLVNSNWVLVRWEGFNS